MNVRTGRIDPAAAARGGGARAGGPAVAALVAALLGAVHPAMASASPTRRRSTMRRTTPATPSPSPATRRGGCCARSCSPRWSRARSRASWSPGCRRSALVPLILHGGDLRAERGDRRRMARAGHGHAAPGDAAGGDDGWAPETRAPADACDHLRQSLDRDRLRAAARRGARAHRRRRLAPRPALGARRLCRVRARALDQPAAGHAGHAGGAARGPPALVARHRGRDRGGAVPADPPAGLVRRAARRALPGAAASDRGARAGRRRRARCRPRSSTPSGARPRPPISCSGSCSAAPPASSSTASRGRPRGTPDRATLQGGRRPPAPGPAAAALG